MTSRNPSTVSTKNMPGANAKTRKNVDVIKTLCAEFQVLHKGGLNEMFDQVLEVLNFKMLSIFELL
jgi:hypothetical protein